ncbi:MAG: hypothetical protein GXO10_01925 [Crenarchaeota archaeon]|nr:hypothetical protein [Thermoproteota archaeon]
MYRRSSIGFLLRGVVTAVLFIIIPLLLLRVIQNIASIAYAYYISNIISRLYTPIIMIAVSASVAVILEKISIVYILSGKERKGTLLGVLTNICATLTIAILLLIILSYIVSVIYVIPLVIGLVVSSVITSLFTRSDRRVIFLLIFTIVYLSSIPLIELLVSKFGSSYIILIWIPLIISLMGLLASLRRSLRRYLSAISFLTLLTTLTMTYVVSARGVIFTLTSSRAPALTYVMDSLIISLILIISFLIVNILFGAEKPLIIETLEPFEKFLELRLDSLSLKIRERLLEFLRTGNKVPLLCSIIEIGMISNDVDTVEKAVKIVEEYSDIKVPPLALKWQVELVNYKNIARRLALVRAVIDILRGCKVSDEDIKRAASLAFSSIPRISFIGVLQKIFLALLIIVPFVAICSGEYFLIYLIPPLVLLLSLMSDATIFPRKYLIDHLIHAYNKYVSIVSSRGDVRNKRI